MVYVWRKLKSFRFRFCTYEELWRVPQINLFIIIELRDVFNKFPDFLYRH